MLSLYSDLRLCRRELTQDIKHLEGKERQDAYRSRYLDIAKLVIKNAQLAARKIINGDLIGFDPIVGENSCQIRTLHAISSYNDPVVKEEAKALLTATEKMLQQIVTVNNKLRNNKMPELDTKQTLDGIFKDLGLYLETSEKMHYLCRAHFLTIGKFYVVTADGREISGIQPDTLRNKLSKGLKNEVIHAIVHVSREQIARASIVYIQQEAAKVSIRTAPDARHVLTLLSDRYVRLLKTKAEAEPEAPSDRDLKQEDQSSQSSKKDPEEDLPLTARRFKFETSCALYNFKTVISRLIEMQTPIVLREYQPVIKGVKYEHPPRTLHYATTPGQPPRLMNDDEVNKLKSDPKNPAVFILQCRFPNDIESVKANIEKIGLVNLINANLAGVNQYSSDNITTGLDNEGQEEVARYKKMCDEWACQTPNPKIFGIVHTPSATMKEVEKWF